MVESDDSDVVVRTEGVSVRVVVLFLVFVMGVDGLSELKVIEEVEVWEENVSVDGAKRVVDIVASTVRVVLRCSRPVEGV